MSVHSARVRCIPHGGHTVNKAFFASLLSILLVIAPAYAGNTIVPTTPVNTGIGVNIPLYSFPASGDYDTKVANKPAHKVQYQVKVMQGQATISTSLWTDIQFVPVPNANSSTGTHSGLVQADFRSNATPPWRSYMRMRVLVNMGGTTGVIPTYVSGWTPVAAEESE